MAETQEAHEFAEGTMTGNGPLGRAFGAPVIACVAAVILAAQAAAEDRFQAANPIYEAHLSLRAEPGRPDFIRVAGSITNRSGVKLQFHHIAFSYTCVADGVRREGTLHLHDVMPVKESDRLRWLPPGEGVVLDLGYPTHCPAESKERPAGTAAEMRFAPYPLPFSSPGFTQQTAGIDCGDRVVGISVELLAAGRAFRLHTTEGERITLSADSFSGDDAAERIGAMVCAGSAPAGVVAALRAGALRFLREWDKFCAGDAEACADAYEKHITGPGVRG